MTYSPGDAVYVNPFLAKYRDCNSFFVPELLKSLNKLQYIDQRISVDVYKLELDPEYLYSEDILIPAFLMNVFDFCKEYFNYKKFNINKGLLDFHLYDL